MPPSKFIHSNRISARMSTAVRTEKHWRSEHLEREADFAAEMVLRGGTGVVGQLSIAPSAAYRYAASTGSPLPASILPVMERGFGADLSRVRIHNNVQVNDLVNGVNARAFTAGRDIYFGPQQYQPSTEQGRHLLYHEVAHVLQQTVPQSAPNISSGNGSGTGPVQLQGIDVSTAFNGFSAIDELYTDYKNNSATKNTLEFIEKITSGLNASFSQQQISTAATDLFEKDVLAGIYDKQSREIRSFIFDCCKRLKYYKGAVYLLDQDGLLKTFFLDEAFIAFIFPKDKDKVSDAGFRLDWFISIIMSHSITSDLFPAAFKFTFRQFLFNPERPVLSIEQFPKRSKEIDEQSKHAHKQQPNERALGAFIELSGIDLVRESEMNKIADDAQAQTTYPARNVAHRQLIRSYKVSAWGKNLLQQKAGQGAQEFLKSYGQLLVSTGDEGIRFWERVRVSVDQIRQLSKADSATPSDTFRKQMRKIVPSDPAIEEFRKALDSQSNLLFSSDKANELPGIREYAGYVDSFTKMAKQQTGKLSSALGKIFGNYDVSGDNPAVAEGIGEMLAFIQEIEFRLSGYKQKIDETDSTINKVADQRIGNRILVAGVLHTMAVRYEWTELEKKANDILTNKEAKKSILALMGEWTDQNAPVDQMEKDFSGTGALIFHDLPITVSHITRAYHLLETESLNNALESLLNVQEDVLDPKSKDMVATAQASIAALPRPRKFTLAPYAIARNEKDPRPDFELLNDHYKLINFVNSHVQSGEFAASIIPKEDMLTEMIVWMIPPFDYMVSVLKKTPGLNELVIAKAGVIPNDPLKWLQQLFSSGADILGLMSSISFGLKIAQQSELSRHNQLLRRVNTWRRRTIASVIEKLLSKYEGNSHGYSKPMDALELIEEFANKVQPDRDKQNQLTALLLQVAPAMKTAFIRDGTFGITHIERFDIITGYYGIINRALKSINDTSLTEMQTLMHPSEDLAILSKTNQDALLAVLDSFDFVRKEKQKAVGIQSRDGKNIQNVKSNIAWEVQPSKMPFMIDGVSYKLIKIHTQFVYHPTYGAGTDAELPGVLTDLNGKLLDPATMLFSVELNESGTTTVVTGEDLKQLDHYVHVFTMQAIILGLNNLAELIEEGMELILDVAEYIPGIGQGIAVARAGVAFLQFVIQELPNIKEELTKGPGSILNWLKDAISGSLDLTDVLYFLLTPNTPSPFAELNKKPEQPKSAPPKSKLGKLIYVVKQIGIRIFKAFMGLKDSMGKAAVNVEAKIADSPTLSYIFQLLPELFAYIGIIADFFSGDEDGTSIFDSLKNAPEKLSEIVSTQLSALQELELPSEVFPLPIAVEFIISFLLDKFRGKGKLVKAALNLTGLMSIISGKIADELRYSDVDPNNLWRELILPKINPYFVDLRDSLVKALYSVVNDVFKKLKIDPLPVPDGASLAEIPSAEDMATDPFPETNPKPISPGISNFSSPPPVHMQAGSPLRGNIKNRYEKDFGNDFSHVRLHQGTDAAQLTQHYQAKGLATGSHIFLQPGMVLDSSAGKDVVRHELTHTVQQTGPRPLGKNYSDTPTPGKPGKGLVFDNQREKEADVIAESMASSDRPVGIEVEKSNIEGFQPSLVDVALGFINVVAHPGFAKHMNATVDAAKLSVRGKDIPELDKAKGIFEGMMSSLGNSKGDKEHAAPFRAQNVKDAVRELITGGRKELAAAIPALAYMAQKNKRGKKSEDPALSNTLLHVSHFLHYLEGYVHAKLGILIHIELDKSETVEYVAYKGVDFTVLPVTSALLGILKTNTTELTAEDWPSVLQLLNTTLVQPFLLDSKVFRLGTDFIERYKRIKTATKDINNLPSWKEYVSPGTKAQTPGLWIGTHGELKALPQEIRRDRQSHHLPQYLLVQYFTNSSSRKLFDNGQLPGFEGGSRPEKFSDGVGHSINFSTLNKGERGDGLPAVLLAADTHRRGRLHLNREGNWDKAGEEKKEMGATITQSMVFDNYFYNTLGTRLHVSSNKKPEVVKKANENPTVGKKAIYQSIQDSYEYLYNLMIESLALALPDLEVPYYGNIAIRSQGDGKGKLKKEYDPRQTQQILPKVIAAVKKKNDDIMKDWKK